jgi:hypothetical protein
MCVGEGQKAKELKKGKEKTKNEKKELGAMVDRTPDPKINIRNLTAILC